MILHVFLEKEVVVRGMKIPRQVGMLVGTRSQFLSFHVIRLMWEVYFTVT